MRRLAEPVPALMDALELRRMLNAATLHHQLLTVYGSAADDAIAVQSTGRKVVVTVDGQTFTFRGTRVGRMRVFGQGGNDTITLGDAYLPNVTDVAIDAGDGNDVVTDASLGHKFNRDERVSVLGGAGNDTLAGGAHTLSLDGGADDDVLFGGAAGASLAGGDGNDLVSANRLTLALTLTGGGDGNDAHGALSLDGGAGDDVVVGNNRHLTGVTDSLTGGDGNDSFFAFNTDVALDAGNGADQQVGGNQFSGSVGVTQTATLTIVTPSGTVFPAQGTGHNGPNSRIVVSDASGTLAMQAPAGSVFLLGDLLNAAGYPVDKLGIPADVTLTINGFASSLTGSQIAGYQINDGDVIVLGVPTP